MQDMKIWQIARLIKQDWKNVNFAAKPYLDAMLTMENVSDNYGQDSGKSIIIYFIANAQTWRGDKAKEIKTELKSRIK